MDASSPLALDGRLPARESAQVPPTRPASCSIVELSSHRAAGSVHLHFPPTIVSFDTQRRPRSLPPPVPSRCCVWRAVPGCCCCFGCLVNTSAAGMVKDRTGRWRGCCVGCRTRIVTQDVLWVLLEGSRQGRSASPAFGNPEQHPGTARGRLRAGFAFLLRSDLSLVTAVSTGKEK